MTKIKNLLKTAFSLTVGLSVLGGMTTVYADNPNYRGNQEGYDTFLGVGYKQYWMSGKGDWKQMLRGNTGGFNFLAGHRIHDYVAYELGYEWTLDKPRLLTLADGTTVLGQNNNTGNNIFIESKTRFKTGYADLQFLMPFKVTETFNPELIVTLGVGTMKASMKFSSDNPLGQTAFMTPFSNLKSKSKTVGRVGVGIQSFLTESVGVRALWRYETTGLLRGSNSSIAQTKATQQLFKNGQSLFLGLILKI